MQIVDTAPARSRPTQQGVRLTASEHQALVQIRQAAQQCCIASANDRLGRTLAEKHGVFVTIRTGLSQGFHGLSHSYLLVQVDSNGPAIVVDGQFKDRFQYGALTGGSYAACVAALPDLFVGTIQAVASLVNILADALQREAVASGHELPPWRTKRALFTNWLPTRFTDQVILPPGSRPVHPVLLCTSHTAPTHLRVLEQCRLPCGDCGLATAPLARHTTANVPDAAAQASPTAACPSLVRHRKDKWNTGAPHTSAVQNSSACDAANGPVDDAPSRLIIRGFPALDVSSGNSSSGDVTSSGCSRATQVVQTVRELASAPTTCRMAIGNAQADTQVSSADLSAAVAGIYCSAGSGHRMEHCSLQRVGVDCRTVEEELSTSPGGAVRYRTASAVAVPDSLAGNASCCYPVREALWAARTKRVSSLTLDLAAAGVVRHQLAQAEQGAHPPVKQPAKPPSGQRAQPGSKPAEHHKQPQQGQQERQLAQPPWQTGKEPRALMAGRRVETTTWEPTAAPAAAPSGCQRLAPGRNEDTALSAASVEAPPPAMANPMRAGVRACAPAGVQPQPACRHGEGQEPLRGTLLVAEQRGGAPWEHAPKRLLARLVPTTAAAEASGDSQALPYTGPALPCAVVPCIKYDTIPRIITVRPVGPLRAIKA